MATSVRNSGSPSRFLALPVEIRLEIYQDILGARHSDTFASYLNRRLDNPPDTQPYPEILRVCSQCHAEAVPILYGNRIFEVDSEPALCHFFTRFLTTIGPRNASLIRQLYVGNGLENFFVPYPGDSDRWGHFIEMLSIVLDICTGLKVVRFKRECFYTTSKEDMEEETKYAIMIADRLLSDGGHPTLGRMVQYREFRDSPTILGLYTAPVIIECALLGMNENQIARLERDTSRKLLREYPYRGHKAVAQSTNQFYPHRMRRLELPNDTSNHVEQSPLSTAVRQVVSSWIPSKFKRRSCKVKSSARPHSGAEPIRTDWNRRSGSWIQRGAKVSRKLGAGLLSG